MTGSGFSLTSRVIIEHNIRLDQRALMMQRPRIERRVSLYIPTTPTSASTRPIQSAPNTPKSVKSILKLSKTKPFTFTGPKRSKNVTTETPAATATEASPQLSTPSMDQVAVDRTSPRPSTSGVDQRTTETSTPANDVDEFYDDIIGLDDNQPALLYETDSEDEKYM